MVVWWCCCQPRPRMERRGVGFAFPLVNGMGTDTPLSRHISRGGQSFPFAPAERARTHRKPEPGEAVPLAYTHRLVRSVTFSFHFSLKPPVQMGPGSQGYLPGIGSLVRLRPGHCDPQVNLFDQIVAAREGRVEAVWRVAARGPGL